MRALLCAAAAMMLAACAGMPGPGTPAGRAVPAAGPARTDALAPQTLSQGACGLFVWTREAPHRFILFENERARRVEIVHAGGIHALEVPAQRADFLPGERIERVYPASGRDLVFTLSGRVGEPTRSGVRIERGLLKIERRDGTDIVRPVLGVRSCRSEMPVAPEG